MDGTRALVWHNFEREDQGLLALFAVWLARFGVWVGRRVIWLLMWTGHALGSFLSRQMEYDADLCEIRMCGSESFGGAHPA